MSSVNRHGFTSSNFSVLCFLGTLLWLDSGRETGSGLVSNLLGEAHLSLWGGKVAVDFHGPFILWEGLSPPGALFTGVLRPGCRAACLTAP